MGEIIAIAIIAVIVGGAIFYVIKAKKSGKKCIGCPDGCSCNGSCGGSCSTKQEKDEKCEKQPFQLYKRQKNGYNKRNDKVRRIV